MNEHDLIELGFERFEEYDSEIGTWYYFAVDWNGIDLISNASDEWDSEGIYVDITETDVRFISTGDIWSLKELIHNNSK